LRQSRWQLGRGPKLDTQVRTACSHGLQGLGQVMLIGIMGQVNDTDGAFVILPQSFAQ